MLLISSASAYNTIITMSITDMKCTGCASGECGSNGDSLTSIIGASGIACVADDVSCVGTTIQCADNDNSIGIQIAEGNTYTTDAVNLTSGNNYYACLELSQKYDSGGIVVGFLPDCASSGSRNYYFDLEPKTICQCVNGINHASILDGPSALVFPYPFIA